jgi:hypothetical protein
MAARKSKNVDNGVWPKIVQGSHLTVKTFEDGRTELVLDWDQLVNEVRAACAGTEAVVPETAAKPKRRGKKEKSLD